MSIFEQIPLTDPEYIKAKLGELDSQLMTIQGRLDNQAAGINAIGDNLQWLVKNVEGIFKMFSSPQFMNQMTSMMTGQMPHATRPAESADATGASSGADATGA